MKVQTITKAVRIVTKSIIPKIPEYVENGCVIRRWQVEVFGLNHKGQVVPLNYVKCVTFFLHETFEKNMQSFCQPPYRVIESGWGEFDLQIIFDIKDDLHGPMRIQHDLNFKQSLYKEEYLLKFDNPSEKLLNILTETLTPIEKHVNRTVKTQKRIPKNNSLLDSNTIRGSRKSIIYKLDSKVIITPQTPSPTTSLINNKNKTIIRNENKKQKTEDPIKTPSSPLIRKEISVKPKNRETPCSSLETIATPIRIKTESYNKLKLTTKDTYGSPRKTPYESMQKFHDHITPNRTPRKVDYSELYEENQKKGTPGSNLNKVVKQNAEKEEPKSTYPYKEVEQKARELQNTKGKDYYISETNAIKIVKKINLLEPQNFNRRQCELMYKFIDMINRYTTEKGNTTDTKRALYDDEDANKKYVFDVAQLPNTKLNRIWDVLVDIQRAGAIRNYGRH